MKFILLALAGLLAADPAFALQPWGKTAAEDAMCRAQIAGRDTSDKRNWGHMHHYCDGLRFYNRAMSSIHDRNEFKYNIQESLGGFDYVLSHTSPDFNMRPEVIAGKARTLALAGRKAEAVMLYTGVVQQTPKYVPAYLYLADHYASSDRKKALSLVSDGLRHNPGTRSLQRRYRELGGKLPYPEPPVQAAPAVTTPPQAEEPAAAAEASAEGDSAGKTAAEPAAEKPSIGSPKNPYCRFCPD
ncbi:MAG: hypothetical protein M1449_02875 [Candidatus Thermoplasmatota archaeon]|nr:hypothetical protein [Candidatus Thermoplasmatota archaeon]